MVPPDAAAGYDTTRASQMNELSRLLGDREPHAQLFLAGYLICIKGNVLYSFLAMNRFCLTSLLVHLRTFPSEICFRSSQRIRFIRVQYVLRCVWYVCVYSDHPLFCRARNGPSFSYAPNRISLSTTIGPKHKLSLALPPTTGERSMGRSLLSWRDI